MCSVCFCMLSDGFLGRRRARIENAAFAVLIWMMVKLMLMLWEIYDEF